MRPVHLVCLGPTHKSYRVVAIKETRDGAKSVLDVYKSVRELTTDVARRSQGMDCGFILSWLMVGDVESELLGDPEFIWDDRQVREALSAKERALRSRDDLIKY